MNMFTEQQEAKTPNELLANLAEVYREQYEWQVRVHKDGRPHKQMADALDEAVEALDKIRKLGTTPEWSKRTKERCEHCDCDKMYYGPPDCPRCGAPNCCEICCKMNTLEMELAAQEAKCKELEAERPKRLCDYDPVEATIGDMVTNFGFDYTNFKFLAEGITRYNDALATAKAECEQLKDHCLDAIKVQNEAQADALELAAQEAKCKELEQWKATNQQAIISACVRMIDLVDKPVQGDGLLDMVDNAVKRNTRLEAALATAKADALELAKEVRRCHALAQDADDRICEGDVAGFALFGDACHEMIDDRPDTVTAAMGRYK